MEVPAASGSKELGPLSDGVGAAALGCSGDANSMFPGVGGSVDMATSSSSGFGFWSLLEVASFGDTREGKKGPRITGGVQLVPPALTVTVSVGVKLVSSFSMLFYTN